VAEWIVAPIVTSLLGAILLSFIENQGKRVRTYYLIVAEALREGSDEILNVLVVAVADDRGHSHHQHVVGLAELADLWPVLEVRIAPLLEDNPLERRGHSFQLALVLQDEVPERDPEFEDPLVRIATTHGFLRKCKVLCSATTNGRRSHHESVAKYYH